MRNINAKNALGIYLAVIVVVCLVASFSAHAQGTSSNGEEDSSIVASGGSSQNGEDASSGSSSNGDDSDSSTGSSSNGEDADSSGSSSNGDDTTPPTTTNGGSGSSGNGDDSGPSTSYLACRDGLDNDNDGKIDLFDPGCSEPFDSDETDPIVTPPPPSTTPPPPPSGGGGNGPIITAAPVVPTSTLITGQVLSATSCSTLYLTGYVFPNRKNNIEDVRKVQTFLNEYLKLTIPVTGYYGPLTIAAVKQFQVSYSTEVLKPWVVAGLWQSEMVPTGNVYKTTQRWINLIKCPDLKTPLPKLQGEATVMQAMAGNTTANVEKPAAENTTVVTEVTPVPEKRSNFFMRFWNSLFGRKK